MMQNNNGYIAEHRLIVVRQLGRPIPIEWPVHHIDHDPLNNAMDNLMLFASNSDHKRFERWGKPSPLWSGLNPSDMTGLPGV